MLLKYSVKGFKTFKDEIEFTMLGNKKLIIKIMFGIYVI